MVPGGRVGKLRGIVVPVISRAGDGWTVRTPCTATMNWQGRQWDVILAPVSRMEARGLTREMIAPGNRIRLLGYPRKDGTAEMRIERIIADGKTVELR